MREIDDKHGGYRKMLISAVLVVEYGYLIRQPADAKHRQYSHHHYHDLYTQSSKHTRNRWLCDCMRDFFDPRERTICGIATVTGGRGAVA